MKRKEQLALAKILENRDYGTLRDSLQTIVDDGKPDSNGTWGNYAQRIISLLDSDFSDVGFNIFAESGNIKLPFVSFSAMAIATCPGIGQCREFCYSLKAWIYPGAFFRQMQNTLLLWENPGAITRKMEAILAKRKFRDNPAVDFRLYVDGDIDSMGTMKFWMEDFLPSFPVIRAYGYSKSFELFEAYQDSGRMFPNNYVLNVSSGSKYDNTAIASRMKDLPITRGEFIALNIDSKRKFSAPAGEYKTREFKTLVRQAANTKVFVCPGTCGNCTSGGHKCGDINFPITIATAAA